jgi:hypothetical protein
MLSILILLSTLVLRFFITTLRKGGEEAQVKVRDGRGILQFIKI